MDPKDLTYTFTVTSAEAQIIASSLAKLPYEESAPIIARLPKVEPGQTGELTFTLPGTDAYMMGVALANLPYHQVVGLLGNGAIGKLQLAINTQIANAQQSQPAQPEQPAALPYAEPAVPVTEPQPVADTKQGRAKVRKARLS